MTSAVAASVRSSGVDLRPAEARVGSAREDSTSLRPAVASVFEQLDIRGPQPRFMVGSDGVWSPVTWQAFADGTRDVAGWCDRIGIEPGDRVAVFAHNRVEWATAAMGIQAVGAVLVPIYGSSPKSAAAYILAHAGAKAVFVDATTVEDCPRQPGLHVASVDPSLDVPGVTSWSALRAEGAARVAAEPSWLEDRLASIDIDAPHLMLYTSGTTGAPKGVPLTHRNSQVNSRDWIDVLRPLLTPGQDVDLLWLPMSHIFGFGELCMGNTLGWTSWMSSPADALKDLPNVAPSIFFSVPRYWEKLSEGVIDAPSADVARARLDASTGGRLRLCLSGGAGLDVRVKEAFRSAGTLIVEGYGLTETSPTLTINRPADYRFDAVGKPLPSVELRLETDGEILARGDSVFSGYFGDAAATERAFTEDGWFRTGDLGRLTDDGFLQIVGRKKEILVTAGGKNVPPANIEQRFAGDPVVAQLVVYGDAKPYLVAGVWLAPGAAAEDVQARVDVVNAELGRWEQIKRFAIIDTPMTVEEGLLTASLKLRRKHVYDRFRSTFEALYEVAR